MATLAAAADDDDGWHNARPEERRDVIGRDQQGRAVYSDRCVIIPGTLRPDGSRRKDRRVRADQLADGSWKSYVPQDEIEAFETRAHREANKPRRIPGLAPADPPPSTKPKAARKNEARKAKKQQQPRDEAPTQPRDEAATQPRDEAPTADDFARKAKNLKKKLKQIAELKATVEAGLEPSGDQKEKLQREAALQAELGEIERKLAAL